MRTKKILSILLAVLLTVGVFGFAGASALELVGEEAELQALPAKDGIPTTSADIQIEARAGKNWSEGYVAWVAYTNSTTPADSYANKRGNGVSVQWTVTLYEKTNGVEDKTKPFNVDVMDDKAAALSKNPRVYKNWSGVEEQLYIEQGSIKYYGTVKVSMKVQGSLITPTTGIDCQNAVDVVLRDQTEYNKLIEDAMKIHAKSDRYTKAYLADLWEYIEAAAWYNDKQPNEATIKSVSDALKAKMDDAANNYQLTTIGFIDNLLGNGFMAFCWSVADFINDLKVVIDPMMAFFGTIGDALKFITPLFSLFGLLLGL